MTSQRFSAAATFFLLISISLTLQAGTIAYTSSGGNADIGDGRTIGWSFSPNRDIFVDALGILDGGSDGPGLQTAHEVGLWRDSDQALLASATVPNGTAGTLISGFRFQAISPLMLTSGTAYRVGAFYSLTGDKLRNAIPTPAADINMVINTKTNNSDVSLTYPSGLNNAWRSTANFTYLVPEPSSLVLAALALLSLLAHGHRRRA